MNKEKKPTMETIREALSNALAPEESGPPTRRMVLKSAIDELEALRESDAALRARVETLTQQFAQAEVDAGEAHEKAEYARILAAGLEEQVQAPTKQRDEARLAVNSNPELVAARLAISGGFGVAEGELPKVIESQLGHFKSERDTAKADAARLREALLTADGSHMHEPTCPGDNDGYNNSDFDRCHHCNCNLVTLREVRAALAATDSAEWLAKHDAEVRAPLEQRIAELEHNHKLANDVTAMVQRDRDALRAKAEALTKQLVAATNDAARAELRAKELKEALENSCTPSSESCKECVWDTPDELHLCPAHAALEEQDTPDSDARLREVMLDVARLRAHVDSLGESDAWVVDEVLRGGA